MKNKIIPFSRFKQLHEKGYNLDIIYLLQLAKDGVDIKSLCTGSPKLEALYQGVFRKGLITEEDKLMVPGSELLTFIEAEDDNEKPLKKKKQSLEGFEMWWKAYPGTDTFTYKGVSFAGSRSLRVKREDCKAKLQKILDEGEYTLQELIQALEYEVMQKKENSVKSKDNKLKFMQNSLTYLNQRTFEPFIELIKEGHKIVEAPQVAGGTDI